ncbi:hypothetical protein B0H14DRAFT_2609394 [Mycena olivaceomarginata]|nr:hypothetical protein B0H14DRAFT_2609394 [Mycena olivaceomarginata]
MFINLAGRSSTRLYQIEGSDVSLLPTARVVHLLVVTPSRTTRPTRSAPGIDTLEVWSTKSRCLAGNVISLYCLCALPGWFGFYELFSFWYGALVTHEYALQPPPIASTTVRYRKRHLTGLLRSTITFDSSWVDMAWDMAAKYFGHLQTVWARPYSIKFNQQDRLCIQALLETHGSPSFLIYQGLPADFAEAMLAILLGLKASNQWKHGWKHCFLKTMKNILSRTPTGGIYRSSPIECEVYRRPFKSSAGYCSAISLGRMAHLFGLALNTLRFCQFYPLLLDHTPRPDGLRRLLCGSCVYFVLYVSCSDRSRFVVPLSLPSELKIMVHTAVPSCHRTTNDQRYGSHIALDLICIPAYHKRLGDLTVALPVLFFLTSLVTRNREPSVQKSDSQPTK